ncbi:MAG: hypothetical protein ABDH21_06875 [bacterium]
MIRGFSTIELVITNVIILLLIFIGLSIYSSNIEYSKLGVFITNVKYIKIASEKYYIDKARYPNSIVDLFTDPYVEYLPKKQAPYFIYSPWQTQITIHQLRKPNKVLLLLYLENIRGSTRIVPKYIEQKMKQELYFYKYYRNHMVFIISYVLE